MIKVVTFRHNTSYTEQTEVFIGANDWIETEIQDYTKRYNCFVDSITQPENTNDLPNDVQLSIQH